MYNTNHLKDYQCQTTEKQTLATNQRLSDLLKMRSRHLPTLLLFIRRLTAKFFVRFLRYQNTIQKSIQQSPSSYNHEPTAKDHHHQQVESSERRRSPIHFRLRQDECETMPNRTDQDVERKPRSDNYHSAIVALKDDFLLQVPPEHIFYQLTIQCRRDALDHTAYKAERVENVIDTVYKRLCETFVHKRNYAKDPHKHLMPHLLAVIEFDDQVLFHAHCLVATCPMLADKFDALRSYDTFKQFDPRITSSHFDRTIPDDREILAFDEPTNVEKWVNYMLKNNRNYSSVKKPDHVILRRPK